MKRFPRNSIKSDIPRKYLYIWDYIVSLAQGQDQSFLTRWFNLFILFLANGEWVINKLLIQFNFKYFLL